MEEEIEKHVKEDRDSKPNHWHRMRLLGQSNKLQKRNSEQQTSVAELRDKLQAAEATLRKLEKVLEEVLQETASRSMAETKGQGAMQLWPREESWWPSGK